MKPRDIPQELLAAVREISVKIEQGDEGLFYATSPDLKGLFVAAPTVDELNVEVPKVIKILIESLGRSSVGCRE